MVVYEVESGAWVYVLLSMSSVTLAKFHTISEPSFCHLENGNSSISLNYSENLNDSDLVSTDENA